MNRKAVILLLSFLIGVSGISAFDKKKFLQSCKQKVGCYAECSTCAVCEDLNLTPEDYESFKAQEYYILDNQCVVFSKSDMGVVNSDFFKQFPNTRRMYFERTVLSLKSSEKVQPHEKMLFLMFLHSTLNDNLQTNALNSLVNLEKLEIIQSDLTSRKMDDFLLKKNMKLRSFVMTSRKNVDPMQSVSIGKDLNLKYIKMNVFLDGFPEDLPKSTETLILEHPKATNLKKRSLKGLKNLMELKLSWADISEIDEDAFDDLEKLEILDLEYNQIQSFRTRHLKNNKHIRTVIFDSKSGMVDLSILGLRKGDKIGVFMKSV